MIKNYQKYVIASILVMILLGVMMYKIPTHDTHEVIWQPEQPEYAAQPRYIFMFIGDGMGMNHRTLAEEYRRWRAGDPSYLLAMNNMTISTMLSTRGLNRLIPDSGAAGTALATGVQSQNGVISMNEDRTQPLRTILQALQDEGMAVGLVTDVAVTHATPATFGANVPNRRHQTDIALQYFEREIDFIAGGGRRYFLPTEVNGRRTDDQDLIEAFYDIGYTINLNLDDFLATNFSESDRFLGLFASNALSSAITQTNQGQTTPTLAQLTQAGIDVLSNDEEGFFLMVEGGLIDTVSHVNDTASVLHQILAFDEAIQVAIDFYHKHPEETLIIVTSDHESGGLGLNAINFENIETITTSFNSGIKPYLSEGDWRGLQDAIAEHWHLELTDLEIEMLRDRFEHLSTLDISEAFGLESDDLDDDDLAYMLEIGGHVVAPVLFDETGVTWSAQGHTAAHVPLTVMGVGSERFLSVQHLVDVPNVLADKMGVRIGLSN
ncbi:MAG: alkaline phosphatase [Defluviitaleaceae bacterium]|nr:alkaline phosphatase [Defluviitaleaceae bacterium]